MITTREVRLILDRNQNGLDGRPEFRSGEEVGPGLYWDSARRVVVSLEARQTIEQPLVLLSERVDVSVDQFVRELAMGGGGQFGRPRPYPAGVPSHSHH